jgi:hypothetical protein
MTSWGGSKARASAICIGLRHLLDVENGVARKTGFWLLISAANPRDFKALPRQCQMTPGKTGQGEEEI